MQALEKCCPCSENGPDNKDGPEDVAAGAKTVYISNGFQLDALPTITVVVDHTVTKNGPTVYITKASDPEADKTRAGGRTDGKTAIPNDKPNAVASGTNPTKAVAGNEDEKKPAGDGRKQGSGKNTGESQNPDSADDEDPSEPAQSSRLGARPGSVNATPPVIGNKPSKTAVGGSATTTGATEDDLEKPSGDKTDGDVPKKSGAKPQGAKADEHQSDNGNGGHKNNGGDEETDNGTGDKAAGNDTADDDLDDNTTNNEVDNDATDKEVDNNTTDTKVDDNNTGKEVNNDTTDTKVDDNNTDEEADDDTTDEKPENGKSDKAQAAESSRKPVAVSGPKSDSRSGTRTTESPGLARVTAPPQTRTVSVDHYRTVTKTLPSSDDDDESGDNIEIIIININTGRTICRTQSGKQCQSTESSAEGNDEIDDGIDGGIDDEIDDQDLEDVCTSGDEPTSTKTVFNTVYATVRPNPPRTSDDVDRGSLASETSSSNSTRTNSTMDAAPARNSTMLSPDRGSWNGTLWNSTATNSAARPRGSTGFLNRQKQRASLLKRLRGL